MSWQKGEEGLQHSLDELVDFLATGTGFSALHKVEHLGLGRESSPGAVELEGPEEVVRLLKVGADGDQFVDQVGCAANTVFAKSLLNDRVVGNGNSLLVELAKAALVDKLLNGGTCGVSVGDVGFNETEHADGGFVESDKGGVVELSEPEKAHDPLGLGGNTNGTADTNHQTELGFGGDVETTLGLGIPTSINGFLLGSGVLGLVLGSVGLELLQITGSLGSSSIGILLGSLGNLSLSSTLLQHTLRSLHCCLMLLTRFVGRTVAWIQYMLYVGSDGKVSGKDFELFVCLLSNFLVSVFY